MNPLLTRACSATFFLIVSFGSYAEGSNECSQQENISFEINDIFDLEAPDTIFLHEWGNLLHIKTKEGTLLNEAAFFVDKCNLEQSDLDELERHLRGQKYIRVAKVEFEQNSKKVKVATWDNWSMMPTVDFGRKGGKNKYAFGIKDRNFLGLGIDAEFESYTNDQRSGYKLKSTIPLFLNNNINAHINFANNDDGTSESLFFTKNFVGSDTKYAFNIGFNNFTQIDTQYKAGEILQQFKHQQKLSTVNWNWLDNDTESDTLRFGIGYTSEQHLFGEADINTVSGEVNLPSDREFSYPFFRVEYLQKDYRKLTNINLINHIEDFNLGWHVTADLGSDISESSTSPTFIWRSKLSKGIDVFEYSYWLFTASFEGEAYDSSDNKDRALFSAKNEYFHKINGQWGAYFKNVTQLGHNQFKDRPIVLGGETGLRGYPLQYLHGDRSTQFTVEARYYPHINIYKLLELGGAAFVDTGRVFGQSSNIEDQNQSWMTSIGLGARFYSTQTSEGRVIHVDVLKPVTSDEKVNNIEFRITTKYSF
jgi:hypothetical protein